jgi:hypothetical protein
MATSSWTDWPHEFTLSGATDFAQDFPNLQPNFCQGNISPATDEYNCFAWAASITSDRWEPDPLGQFFWPQTVMRSYELDSYIAAFRTVGFEVCSNGSLENGIEKIAIYVDGGQPQHAARQLENGNWTTKFGDFEDIEHTDLACLHGPVYGSVHLYMWRPRGLSGSRKGAPNIGTSLR